MSEQQLKDLFGELVDEVPRPDPHRVDVAWSAGRRRRQRGSALVAAAAVATLLAATAVVVAPWRDDDSPPPGQGTPSPSPSPTEQTSSSRPPDARYRGAPVWWAPPAGDESRLATFGSALPPTVDLSAGLPELVPGQPALGLFTVMTDERRPPERVVVLSRDGTTAELPSDRVAANLDEAGNGAAIIPPNGGLSPDGWHAFFAQRGSIEVYDFADGSWTTIATPGGVAEGARWLGRNTLWVPQGLVLSGVGSTYDADGRMLDAESPRILSDLDLAPADEPYGAWVDTPGAWAGSYYFAGPVGGGDYTNPEGLVARVGSRTSVLAISIMDGRYKACCPVVGWLDDDVVAFQSNDRVLAWQAGTGNVYRVTDLSGIDRDREWLDASWAWLALR